jgi:hypothetical protein
LIDLERKQRGRFLTPPIFNILWNRDGSRLAVVSAAGRFGRFSTEARVDFYDEQGHLLRSISVDPQIHFLGDARWADGYLVVRLYRSSSRGNLWIVSPDTGERRSIAIELAPRNWALLGPDDEGNLYVFRARSNDWPASTAVVLQRIDVERAELDPLPLLEEEGFVAGDEQQFYFYGYRISPGGRYLQRARRRWFDLHSGREHRLPHATWTEWLTGDRLAWLEKEGSSTRLLWGAPGEEPELLRRWEGGSVTMAASPDRERLLVSAFDLGEDPKSYRFQFGQKLPADARLSEMWIVEPAAARWIDAASWVDRSLTFREQRVNWAGPGTLALTGPGFLALREIDPSAEPRYLFGSPVRR